MFAQRGYANSSLREVAAEAGMEKGHVTYYFSAKEDLLFEIIDELHERFLAGIAEWTAGDDVSGDEALLRVFRSHLLLVFSAIEQTTVAYDNFRFLGGPRRATIVEKRDAYEQALAQCIDASRSSTVVTDEVPTHILTKVVLAQLNWPYRWYHAGSMAAPEDVAATLAGRALASLRPS